MESAGAEQGPGSRNNIELLLKGESAPSQAAVKSYELSSEAGETFIALGDIETSRQRLARAFSANSGSIRPEPSIAVRLSGAITN
jgi:hypothetical protein